MSYAELVREHQRRTTASYLELTQMWPEFSDSECLRGAASIGRRIAGGHRLWVVGREVEQDRRHGEGRTFSD